MANPNLTRIHQKIFSENAANNGQFGSLQAGTIVENPNIAILQALPAYQEGWSDAVISGEELPSLEEFNGLHKIETEQLQYLLNKGIPEYSADAEYYIGDIQREVGGTKLYKSITDNNIGNALTDIANWEIYYDPDNSIFDNVTINNKLNAQPNLATISNNEIPYTGLYMVIDTEGGAATDDLDTISGANDGDLVLITLNNSNRNVVIKHNVGNIFITEEEDILLDLQTDSVLLRYDGINAGAWYVVSRSINADFAGSQATKTESGITFLPNQITIENDSGDLNHDILFNAGNFNFDDGSGQAVLSSNLVKQIDAAWVVGNNQGGLFSGTVAANSTYHMFVISNDDGSLVDAGFSSDIDAADIPTGYTKKRRIASLVTNASSNIRTGEYIFSRNGSYNFIFNTSVLAIGGSGNYPLTLTNLSIATPSSIKTSPSFDCLIRSTGSDGIAIADFDTETEFRIASCANSQNTGSLSSGALFTNLNSQVKYRNSGNDAFVDFNFDINVCGWFDNNL